MKTSSRRKRSTTTAPAGTVVAYLRLSTDGQTDSGAGLAAQRATIEAEAARRDWTVVQWFTDAAASGKSLAGRPELSAALDAVRAGRASTLVVAKLDRLSRSVVDFAGLMADARAHGGRSSRSMSMSTPPRPRAS